MFQLTPAQLQSPVLGVKPNMILWRGAGTVDPLARAVPGTASPLYPFCLGPLGASTRAMLSSFSLLSPGLQLSTFLTEKPRHSLSLEMFL